MCGFAQQRWALGCEDEENLVLLLLEQLGAGVERASVDYVRGCGKGSDGDGRKIVGAAGRGGHWRAGLPGAESSHSSHWPTW